MNKQASLDQVREGIARLKRNRILTYASFILASREKRGHD